MMRGWIDRGEDLEVFQRAYRVSLEVHRASLDFPRIEQFALDDQVRRAFEVDLRQPGGGVWPPASVQTGVPPVCGNGDRFCGRDAGMGALLS